MGTAEVWKVIEGFEDYEVSNHGRISHNGKILKGTDNGIGYKRVMFKVDGRRKFKYVHRLVASAFIPNRENKPLINHIDNNPANNHVDNLEWCTHQENTDWMKKQGRNIRTEEWLQHLHESQEKYCIGVIGENIKTGEKIYFSRLNDVKKAGFQPSCVCNCCKGNRGVKQHKGYRWRYESVGDVQ